MLRSLAVIFAGLLAACTSPPDAPTFDILIINGTVYDGSLSPGRKANIGISGARIMSIDASVDATARTVIDANGKLVVPGFIDPHTHAAITIPRIMMTPTTIDWCAWGCPSSRWPWA